jgi:hypothetical protein
MPFLSASTSIFPPFRCLPTSRAVVLLHKKSCTLPFNCQLFFFSQMLSIMISYIEYQMTHCSDSSYFTVQYLYVLVHLMTMSIILNQHTYSSGQNLPDSIPWVDPSQGEMGDIFNRLLGGGSAHSLSF